MKILKIVTRIIGIGFFIAGLFYFLNALGSVATNPYIFTLTLRVINGTVWIVVGYGLFRLKLWSLYGLGLIVLLDIFTIFYNQLVFGIPPVKAWPRVGLGPVSFHIVLLFLFYTVKDKLFEK